MSEEKAAGSSAAQEGRIRVCIVDDDPFVTTSLATILAAEPDVAVAGEGCDGEAAVALFERERPDVLLMDIQMPGMDGLAAAERILAAHPEARIVFLTTFSDDEYIVRALRLGAKGYLIKQEVATIAPALRTVTSGQSVLGGEVLGRVEALVQGGGRGRPARRGWHPPPRCRRCRAPSRLMPPPRSSFCPNASAPSWSWWPRVWTTRR